MKLHLATALGALLLCLAGPALGQLPKGPIDPFPGPGPHKVIDLSINKRATGPVVAGQTATFVLDVTNSGNAAVNSGMGIQVIDPLPNGFSGPMTGFGSGWSCGQVGGSLICNWVGGTILAGAPFPPITMTAVAGNREGYEQCARVRISKVQDMRPGNDNDCVTGRVERPQGGRYDVRIRKDGPATVVLGQIATFTIQVTNQGPSPVGGTIGLTVTDSVPANFTNVAATGVGWNCILAGSQPTQVTCTYVGAPVNATLQFPVITITGKVEKGGPYLNCAEADFRKAEDGNPRDNRDCAEGRVTEGGKGYDVGIRKTYTPSPGTGQPATFTLNPFNNGPSAVSAASGVQVTDTLPANFQPNITASGTNWNCSVAGGGPWTVICGYTGPSVGTGPLPPIQIQAMPGEPGKFTNCAEIGFDRETDRNPRDNRGCVDGEVSRPTGGKPDIDISKTALEQPWSWPAGTGVYRFKISNIGDAAVPAGHTVTLTETMPAGMVLISMPNAWSCTPGAGTAGPATITCTYVLTAALNPGAFIQFDMTVGFNGKKEPRYQNCASVAVAGKTGAWREINMANNRDCEPTEVSGGNSYFNIGIDKTGPSALTVGQTGTYTLTVTNASTTPLDLTTYTPPPYVTVYTPVITVTDTLPGIFNPPVTVSGGPNWNCTATGLAISCTYIGGGIIPSGALLPPITVSATVGKTGMTQNCAVASLGGGWFIVDIAAANNTDCVPVVVRDPVQPPSLQINKTVLDDCFQNGNGNDIRCTFRITVTNTGGSAWTGPVQFTDTIQPQGASNTVLVGGQPAGWTCSGSQPMVCNTNAPVTIAGGGSVSADFTVDIMSPIIPTQNCVSLVSPIALGPVCVPLGNSPPPPPLFLEKVVDQDCTGSTPFTACKFSIRVFNYTSTPYTGPLTLSDTIFGPSGPLGGGVSLASPLPPGWTCTGAQPALCSIANITVPAMGNLLVPLNMTVSSAIPPTNNCVTLTVPPNGTACVNMGSTHFDLGLDSNLLPAPNSGNQKEFSFWVSSSPTVINGSVLVFNGSVTTSGTLSPMLVSPTGWSCSGPWTGFVCSRTVTTGAFSGALIPLRLRTTYPPGDAGLPVTFTGQIQMNGNGDPVTSNNSRTVTTTLP